MVDPGPVAVPERVAGDRLERRLVHAERVGLAVHPDVVGLVRAVPRPNPQVEQAIGVSACDLLPPHPNEIGQRPGLHQRLYANRQSSGRVDDLIPASMSVGESRVTSRSCWFSGPESSTTLVTMTPPRCAGGALGKDSCVS